MRFIPAAAIAFVVGGAFSGGAQSTRVERSEQALPHDISSPDLSARPLRPSAAHVVQTSGEASLAAADHAGLTAVVRTYCRTCHNDRARSGNLSLDGFDVAGVAESAQTADTAMRFAHGTLAGWVPPPTISGSA